MAFYLAFKEVWRNRGRFFLFSLVIALITVLVLFIAGLGEGLATANKEFLEKIDADLLILQNDVELSTTASRIGNSKLNDIQRVDGISEVGPIGLSSTTLEFPVLEDALDMSLIGVDTGMPGMPAVIEGRTLRTERGYEAIIDEDIAREAGVGVGDKITIKSIQGTEDKFFDLTIVGITTGQQYFFLPSIFVPNLTWDRIRPQASPGIETELAYNMVAVRTDGQYTIDQMIPIIESQVEDVEAATQKTVYESGPGYAQQQSTVNTQKAFTLLIGVLVIGGFFQIQTLQKIPQIGMLKAIGASNPVIATASILQIIIVTLFGVLLGSLVVFGLSLGLPPSVPITFSGPAIVTALVALILIGPVGGMVSVRLALKVEPLTALGLGS